MAKQWILGAHRLMCADSTDKETVLNFLGNQIPDMILTDPPYKMSYGGGGCFKDSTDRVNERLKKLINFDASTIAFYRSDTRLSGAI